MDITPTNLNHILLAGMEEAVGQEELIRLTGGLDSGSIDAIVYSAEVSYGQAGSCGIAVHCGRAFFTRFFREFAHPLGMQELSYLMLPKPRRIEEGLKRMAGGLKTAGLAPIEITPDDTGWVILLTGTDHPQDTPLDPIGYFTVGFLQEYLAWASGGKAFNIYPLQKTSPAGSQASRWIRIDKKVLD